MHRRNFLKLSGASVLGTGALASPFLYAKVQPEFQLTARKGQHQFIANQQSVTNVFAYNDSIPGPIIRIPRKIESVIEFRNQLVEPSSIHWHGLRISNDMDGVPGMTQALVQPGENFTYRLVPPDAGTYWYHSHQRSWEQIARGLAGVLIVEDDNPPRVDQDLVCAVDDWRIDNSMQLDERSFGALHDWGHGGRTGNMVSINGTAELSYDVSTGERIRLRTVNIANARIMSLHFKLPSISVVAIDGQPVKPYPLKNGLLTLAPGQRADLMIDVTLSPNQQSPIELIIRNQAFQIGQFRTGEVPARDNLIEDSVELEANPINQLTIPEKTEKFTLLMEGGAMGNLREAIYNGKRLSFQQLVQNRKIWAFNGVSSLAETPLFRVKQGTAIALDVINNNAWPHGIHVHGHHFIDERQSGIWRDTALFQRGDQSTLSFIADNPGKWLIHCHMIEHQAGGMVTWFEVT